MVERRWLTTYCYVDSDEPGICHFVLEGLISAVDLPLTEENLAIAARVVSDTLERQMPGVLVTPGDAATAALMNRN